MNYGSVLWRLAKPHNIRPIAPCEARKIEAGILNHGQSMTIANNPYEIMGFERLVEEQSADYIGKQALGKNKTRRSQKKNGRYNSFIGKNSPMDGRCMACI